jgi:hypothetical protein
MYVFLVLTSGRLGVGVSLLEALIALFCAAMEIISAGIKCAARSTWVLTCHKIIGMTGRDRVGRKRGVVYTGCVMPESDKK